MSDLDRSVPTHDGHSGFWQKVWQVLQIVQARLRFIAILCVIGLVLSFWGTIANYYEKWTRFAVAAPVGDPDIEYFCPMHPYIVRDNPREKCPICHMDLARRKKGTDDSEPLPAGTVSRVQLTPYRVVLAGVQTWEVRHLALTREITTFGTVEFDETRQAHIATTQKGRIVKMHVNSTGQTVEKGEKLAILDIRYSPDLTVTLEDLQRARQSGNQELERMARQRLRVWDIGDEQITEFLRTGKVNTQLTIYSPIKGHVIKKYQREGNFVDEGTPLYDVAALDVVWVEAQVYEADQSLLEQGQNVRVATLSLPGQVFEGAISFVYPHLDEGTRTLTVRMAIPNRNHQLRPGMYATVKIEVQPTQIASLTRAMAERWATESAAAATAQAVAGPLTVPPLQPLVQAAANQVVLRNGRVLAVPDSAIIDTGTLKIVYREAAPNTYEGVSVQLGPRLTERGNPTAFYPVLSGLRAGEHVVTNGSFLVDAETRLNPAAGSIYFGGTGGKGAQGIVAVRPSTPGDEDAGLAKLSPDDRRLALAQKFCPILPANRLGSMGTPVKLLLDGQPVFLCCPGCEKKAKADPHKTLAKAEELKAKLPAPVLETNPGAGEDADARTNRAQLPSQDRALADAQMVCPITGKELGSMGIPLKVDLQGQSVFLCCKACERKARTHAEETLKKIQELRGQGPHHHNQ